MRETRTLVIIAVALAVVAVLGIGVAGAMAGPGMMGPGMMWRYGSPDGPGPWAWGVGMGLGWLAMLAFWGLVILGIILLVRALTERPAAGPSGVAGERPLDILKRRYAAGEIDQATYERMKRELES